MAGHSATLEHFCGACGRDDFRHHDPAYLRVTVRNHPPPLPRHLGLGPPSLEVLSQPPRIPTLGGDALRVLATAARLNEVLRSFQGDLAVLLQQAGFKALGSRLLRHVPGVPTPSVQEADSDALEHLEAVLSMAVSLTVRVKEDVGQALAQARQAQETAEAHAREKDASIQAMSARHEATVAALKSQLNQALGQPSDELYAWPTLDLDRLYSERLKRAESQHEDLQLRHAVVLEELAKCKASVRLLGGLVPTLQQERDAAQRALAANAHRRPAPAPPLHRKEADEEDVPTALSTSESPSTLVNGAPAARPALAITEGAPPPTERAPSPQLPLAPPLSSASLFASMSVLAASRITEIPDLKLAAWLQQYVVLQRAAAMEEEAKKTWLRPGVTERYLRRLREWKQRKLTEWQQHYQKLVAIEDQLLLYSSTVAPTISVRRRSSIQQRHSFQRQTVFGYQAEATSRYWSPGRALAQVGDEDSSQAHAPLLPVALASQASRPGTRGGKPPLERTPSNAAISTSARGLKVADMALAADAAARERPPNSAIKLPLLTTAVDR